VTVRTGFLGTGRRGRLERDLDLLQPGDRRPEIPVRRVDAPYVRRRPDALGPDVQRGLVVGEHVDA
jgi:hypothetical protein